MTDQTAPIGFVPFAYPDLRDPRVILCIPAPDRAAMTSLWALVERLLTIAATAREPMLAQIKLAWWRDMLEQLARDGTGLPLGEPLLAELTACWCGPIDLTALATGTEALLLASDDKEAITAAEALGQQVWRLTKRSESVGAEGGRWGLVAAAIQSDAARAAVLLAHAVRLPRVSRGGKGVDRALFMLDRWALSIARRGGKRSLRSEAMLLLRIGLFGR